MVEMYCGGSEQRARILIGAAVMAAMKGKNVLFVSFGRDYSDCDRLFEISQHITLLNPGINSAREYFDSAVRMAITFKYNVLILDDILGAAERGCIPEAQVLEFLSDAPDSIEIICAGEKAYPRFLRLADKAVGLSYLK